MPPLTRLNLVESNGDGEFTFGDRAVASDPAASFCTSIPVVWNRRPGAAARKFWPGSDTLPTSAKLVGVRLLMTQVPLISVCPVTPVILTAEPFCSPAVLFWVIIVTGVSSRSVLLICLMLSAAVALLPGGR